ncbi:MAG: hypothetical protein DMG28_07060 [Acidobacteria bacterium]|nr:MAG: hypothetical protein DMG28_07060 [Acidobacteriota bacterium]
MKRAKPVFVVCTGVLVLLGLPYVQQGRSSLPASAASDAQKDPGAIRFVKNPEPVPEFTLRDLDGQPISPAHWRGKVILLNFWATWCGPCRAEIPDLIQLQAKYAGRLQIIGLSVDEGPAEAVKRFAQRARINYPIAIASPELQAKFGSILALPTLFLLDTNGGVVQKHIGLRNPVLYETEVRALLGLPVEAKIETFEDTGQIFLANAKRATELPGVDLSKLTPEQRKVALREFNRKNCNCKCDLTLAQCRINDTSCPVSEKLAKQEVEKILHGESAQQEAPPKK